MKQDLIQCDKCKKFFKRQGLGTHKRMMHGVVVIERKKFYGIAKDGGSIEKVIEAPVKLTEKLSDDGSLNEYNLSGDVLEEYNRLGKRINGLRIALQYCGDLDAEPILKIKRNLEHEQLKLRSLNKRK